jgi:hypothetical protein
LRNKPFEVNTKNLIRQIPNASNKEQIDKLLQLIKDTNDKGIEGMIQFI